MPPISSQPASRATSGLVRSSRADPRRAPPRRLLPRPPRTRLVVRPPPARDPRRLRGHPAHPVASDPRGGPARPPAPRAPPPRQPTLDAPRPRPPRRPCFTATGRRGPRRARRTARAKRRARRPPRRGSAPSRLTRRSGIMTFHSPHMPASCDARPAPCHLFLWSTRLSRTLPSQSVKDAWPVSDGPSTRSQRRTCPAFPSEPGAISTQSKFPSESAAKGIHA